MIFGTPPIVTNGLVLHLDAGSRQSYPGSGTTWTDLSGQGNSGSLVSGPTYNSANQGNITFVSQSQQYVNINNTTGNGSAISLESWFRTTTTTPWLHLLAKGSANQYQYALRLGYTSPTSIGVVAWTSIGNNYAGFESVGTTVNDGKWHHVVGIIIEGTGAYLYIDGTLNVTNLTVSGTWNKNGIAPLRIGGRADSVDYFTGDIANVKIYNRALSAAEIAQNYNALKSRFGLT